MSRATTLSQKLSANNKGRPQSGHPCSLINALREMNTLSGEVTPSKLILFPSKKGSTPKRKEFA